MKFRNYCALILGKTQNALSEIEHISEIPVNFLDANGVFIATFASILEPNEIKEFLIGNKRNFFVFDLDSENSAVNIMKDNINKTLFSFLDDPNNKELSRKFSDMVIEQNDKVNKLNPKLIEKLSPAEKQKILDELLDIGVENLTENDRKLLPLLAK